jgi:copper homeostasis protein CutC
MRAPVLEVIVTSLDDAIEAERGGATRLEVVRDLDRGGLTPSLGLVHDIVAAVRIPIRVMVRESDLLTRGGERTVEGRAAWLRRVAHEAWPEISVIMGGGVNASVIRALRRKASVGAFHVGRAARVPESAIGCVSATKVRALRELLETETSPA